MMKILKWFMSLFRTEDAECEALVARFIEAFPGKCFICSWHSYGVFHGLTTDEIEKHTCIEERERNHERN